MAVSCDGFVNEVHADDAPITMKRKRRLMVSPFLYSTQVHSVIGLVGDSACILLNGSRFPALRVFFLFIFRALWLSLIGGVYDRRSDHALIGDSVFVIHEFASTAFVDWSSGDSVFE